MILVLLKSDFGRTPCICCHLTQTNYFLWGHPFATVIYTMTRHGLYRKFVERLYLNTVCTVKNVFKGP